MDLRYYVTFPGGNVHLPRPMGMPFLDIAGRICSWHKASNLGPHSWRVKWENILAFYRFIFCPHFPWSNLVFHRGRGMGPGQGYCSPQQSGSSLFLPAQVNATDRMLLTQWDVFLPRGLSIWTHPEKWSPWVQCKRALSPVTGPREAQGWRDPYLLLLGTAMSSDLVLFSNGPPMSASSRSDLLQAPPPGKEARWGDASCRGC